MKKRVDKLIEEDFVKVIDFDIDSELYELSTKLHRGYLIDKEIGKGEAAAISLAVLNNGILASNNTKDVMEAIMKFKIKRIKTGDILVKAYHCNIITESEGNDLWKRMISQKRFLTEESFTKYLNKNPEPKF